MRYIIFILLAFVSYFTQAQTVYRCHYPNGSLMYSDTPCGGGLADAIGQSVKDPNPPSAPVTDNTYKPRGTMTVIPSTYDANTARLEALEREKAKLEAAYSTSRMRIAEPYSTTSDSYTQKPSYTPSDSDYPTRYTASHGSGCDSIGPRGGCVMISGSGNRYYKKK